MHINHNDKHSPFWELLPMVGLGPIRFLMPRSEVDTYQHELGLIVGERSDNLDQQQKNLQDTFSQFSEFFSEQDLKDALAALQSYGDGRENVSRVFMKSGISLEYETDQLVEIFADSNVKNLHFLHMPIFDLAPKDLIVHISHQLEEIPIFKDDEVVFREHKLFLFSFLTEEGDAWKEGEKRNRSIIWRNTDRVNGCDLSEYRPLTLI